MKKLALTLASISLAACGGSGSGGSQAENFLANDTTSYAEPTQDSSKNNESRDHQTVDTDRTDIPSVTNHPPFPSRRFANQFDTCPIAIPSPLLESARCLIGSYTGKEEKTSRPCSFELLDDMTAITTGENTRIVMSGPFRASIFNKNYVNGPTPPLHAGYVIHWELVKLTRDEQKLLTFSFNKNWKNDISVYALDSSTPGSSTNISCIIDAD